jgi:hypothetical protein
MYVEKHPYILLLAVLNQGLHEHEHQEAVQHIRSDDPQIQRRPLDIIVAAFPLLDHITMREEERERDTHTYIHTLVLLPVVVVVVIEVIGRRGVLAIRNEYLRPSCEDSFHDRGIPFHHRCEIMEHA